MASHGHSDRALDPTDTEEIYLKRASSFATVRPLEDNMTKSALEVLAWGLAIGFPLALICHNVPYMAATVYGI